MLIMLKYFGNYVKFYLYLPLRLEMMAKSLYNGNKR